MRRLTAYPVYLVLTGVTSLAMTIRDIALALYFVREVGMNPFQLVTAGTVFMTAVVLCEVPTGVVADVYSRRLSVVFGAFIVGAALLLEGSFPALGPVLVAQALWGVGLTFNRGALEAWIADGTGASANLGRVFLRGAQASYLGSLCGIGLGVLLANVRLNLPSLAAGTVLVMLGGFLAVWMPERGFVPSPRDGRRSTHVAAATLRDGVGLVRASAFLPLILGIVFFQGMSSETYDRLWEVHFLANYRFPGGATVGAVGWFGIITAGGLVLSILVAEVARRRLNTSTHRGAIRALFAINVGLLLSVVGFGLAGKFGVALSAYWTAYLLRQTNGPLFAAWLNQNLEPRVRATVISLSGQVDAIGKIAGGPAFGALATVTSTGTAMAAAGLVYAPAIALYVRAARRGRRAVDSTVPWSSAAEG